MLNTQARQTTLTSSNHQIQVLRRLMPPWNLKQIQVKFRNHQPQTMNQYLLSQLQPNIVCNQLIFNSVCQAQSNHKILEFWEICHRISTKIGEVPKAPKASARLSTSLSTLCKMNVSNQCLDRRFYFVIRKVQANFQIANRQLLLNRQR